MAQDPHWQYRLNWARTEVRATIKSLPIQLRAHAAGLPVTFEHRPNEDLRLEGIEPDTLGLFVGSAFAENDSAGPCVPAQIILFLDNLWDMADEDVETFQAEIRATYLHELGHYLGLDESDLTARELD